MRSWRLPRLRGDPQPRKRWIFPLSRLVRSLISFLKNKNTFNLIFFSYYRDGCHCHWFWAAGFLSWLPEHRFFFFFISICGINFIPIPGEIISEIISEIITEIITDSNVHFWEGEMRGSLIFGAQVLEMNWICCVHTINIQCVTKRCGGHTLL